MKKLVIAFIVSTLALTSTAFAAIAAQPVEVATFDATTGVGFAPFSAVQSIYGGNYGNGKKTASQASFAYEISELYSVQCSTGVTYPLSAYNMSLLNSSYNTGKGSQATGWNITGYTEPVSINRPKIGDSCQGGTLTQVITTMQFSALEVSYDKVQFYPLPR